MRKFSASDDLETVQIDTKGHLTTCERRWKSHSLLDPSQVTDDWCGNYSRQLQRQAHVRVLLYSHSVSPFSSEGGERVWGDMSLRSGSEAIQAVGKAPGCSKKLLDTWKSNPGGEKFSDMYSDCFFRSTYCHLHFIGKSAFSACESLKQKENILFDSETWKLGAVLNIPLRYSYINILIFGPAMSSGMFVIRCKRYSRGV